MNLTVEHVLMIALVMYVFYHFMCRCGCKQVEGLECNSGSLTLIKNGATVSYPEDYLASLKSFFNNYDNFSIVVEYKDGKQETHDYSIEYNDVLPVLSEDGLSISANLPNLSQFIIYPSNKTPRAYLISIKQGFSIGHDGSVKNLKIISRCT
jgi:hypothetical protein